MSLPWTIQRSDVATDRRTDPEFYDPRVEAVEAALREAGAIPLRRWVTDAFRGVAPEYDDEGTIRVIKTAHVRRFFLADTPVAVVTEDFAEANARAAIPEGALLITGTGVGSAARAFLKTAPEPMIADAHVTVLPSDDTERAAFACAYLQSPVGRQQLWRWRRGSSRQVEIYPADFLSVLVPDLSDDHQRSIAERWLAATERVRESATAVQTAEQRMLDRLGASAPCTAQGTAASWTTSLSALKAVRRIDAESRTPTVEQLRERLATAGARSLGSMITGSRKGVQPEAYSVDGAVRVIKSKDVRFPDLDLVACDRTNEDEWPYYLNGGELLLNTTGQGTLGRAGVMPRNVGADPPAVPSVDVYALDIDPTVAVPEYVALFLGSEIGRTLSESLQTGSSGQQHLYPVHFDDLPVLVPVDEAGDPDLTFQHETARVARARAVALQAARDVARDLDAEFLSAVGVPVDLAVIPA